MSESIIASILYQIGFIAFFAVLFLLKKSERKLSGVIWLVLTLMIEMCWGAFTAAFINIVRIPVNIYSMGVIYLLSAVLVGVKVRKEKEFQKYKWEMLDILVSVVVFLGMAALVLYKVGLGLEPVFSNSDAAVHLKNAMSVIQSEKLPTMYFAPFQLAMVLEVVSPVCAVYNFYKIFIVVDVFLFSLEIIFFYLFCKEYFEKKWMKLGGAVLCIFYAAGYPLMSYLMTFYYWALGVMLMGVIVLLLRQYRRKEIRRDYAVFAIMLGCNAVTMCYMLLGPVTFIAAFICLVFDVKQEGKIVTKKNFLLALKVFLVPTLLAIYYCYFEFLQKKAMSAADVIAIDGGIYRNVYINFLLIMPLVAYMIIRSVKKKKADENMIFFLSILVFVLVLFVLVLRGKVSGYYYYKFYYPLWFFAFVLAIQGVGELLEKQWEILASYGLVIAFLFVMHFGGIEQWVVKHPANVQDEEYAGGVFHIYDFNRAYLSNRNKAFSEEQMDICKYVVEELEEKENVPLIANQQNYEKCYWYEAITGEDSSEYYGWFYKFKKVAKKLDEQKVKYFAVFKDSAVFLENQEYFEEFSTVYENAAGVIYSTAR